MQTATAQDLEERAEQGSGQVSIVEEACELARLAHEKKGESTGRATFGLYMENAADLEGTEREELYRGFVDWIEEGSPHPFLIPERALPVNYGRMAEAYMDR